MCLQGGKTQGLEQAFNGPVTNKTHLCRAQAKNNSDSTLFGCMSYIMLAKAKNGDSFRIPLSGNPLVWIRLFAWGSPFPVFLPMAPPHPLGRASAARASSSSPGRASCGWIGWARKTTFGADRIRFGWKNPPITGSWQGWLIVKTTVYNINVLVSNLITKSKPLTNQNYRINTLNVDKHIKAYYEI